MWGYASEGSDGDFDCSNTDSYELVFDRLFFLATRHDVLYLAGQEMVVSAFRIVSLRLLVLGEKVKITCIFCLFRIYSICWYLMNPVCS